jgi:CHASE2 domain-containing sensor protein
MTKKTRLLLKDSFLCTIFSSILIAILSLIVVNMSFFNPLKKVLKDFSFLDVYYAENFNDSNGINADIVLINIEHRDRFELSQMIDKVMQGNPKIVGTDIMLVDKKVEFMDSYLSKSLNNDKIVSSYIIQEDSIEYNHPLFDKNKYRGFVNLNFENDVLVVREFAGSNESFGETHLSFASQIVKQVLPPSEWESRKFDKVLKGNTTITYQGYYDAFLTFSYDEFMENNNSSLLKDKIVLIGYLGDPTGNEYDVEDKKFTPLNKVTAGKSIPDMYGLVVHANIINMLLKNDIMYRVSNFWIGIITYLSTFLLIMALMRLEKNDKISFRTKKQIILFLFTIIVTGLALWLFKIGIILKITPIIAVTLLSSSYIRYYKDLIDYIKSKRKWKSYIR